MNTDETRYQQARKRGIGLFAHALSAYGFGPRFGAEREERKIRELMEKE